MAAPSAIVVGAGIGGLTTALALRQAGVDVAVYERADELRQIQVGGGIHVWHNGMRVLQRLGVGEEVAALGGRAAAVQTQEFRNHRGRVLARWPIDELERDTGAPTVGVVRSELHGVLVRALEDGVLHLGAACTGFAEDGTAAVARFADGAERRADVIVGADGLRSTIRAQLLGAEEPRYAGYASWQAFATLEHELAPVGYFAVTFGPGARFLSYRIGPDRLYWEGIVAMPAGGSDEGGRKQAVLDRFRDWCDPIPAIVEATEEAAITGSDIYDRPFSKEWGRGRVTLLGDAAHAMTNALGQGANQAMEDSLVLADELAKGVDPAAALRAYEARRRKRAGAMARLSTVMTRLSRLRRPWQVGLRDRWISFSFNRFVFKQMRGTMTAEP